MGELIAGLLIAGLGFWLMYVPERVRRQREHARRCREMDARWNRMEAILERHTDKDGAVPEYVYAGLRDASKYEWRA